MRSLMLTLLAFVFLQTTFVTKAQDPATPAFVKVPELCSGFRQLYIQKFPEGRAQFEAWETQHPDEPFGQVAIAASYLFEEFYHQGVLTSDFFLNEKKFLHGIDGEPDPARMQGFDKAIGGALPGTTGQDHAGARGPAREAKSPGPKASAGVDGGVPREPALPRGVCEGDGPAHSSFHASVRRLSRAIPCVFAICDARLMSIPTHRPKSSNPLGAVKSFDFNDKRREARGS